jgi:protoheme IX farnesyltransferase
VFSSLAGFMLGVVDFNVSSWMILLKLAVGGYCMVGASNAYNQVIEKELDALMDRTKNRPVPAGRMTATTALTIAVLLTLVGIAMLYTINPKTAMFGAISIFLIYEYLHTIKNMTPLSVFVGAFPGAIPFMLGWVAATGNFGIEAGTLFLIQFFWQFPHFWAIGWFLYDDYAKKQVFLCCQRERKTNRLLCKLYLYGLADHCFVASSFGVYWRFFYYSNQQLSVIFVLGLWMLFYAVQLYKTRTTKAARTLMLVSVSYITLLQIIYILR